jgi:hypothetical protein
MEAGAMAAPKPGAVEEEEDVGFKMQTNSDDS